MFRAFILLVDESRPKERGKNLSCAVTTKLGRGTRRELKYTLSHIIPSLTEGKDGANSVIHSDSSDLPRFNPPVDEINPRSPTFRIFNGGI